MKRIVAYFLVKLNLALVLTFLFTVGSVNGQEFQDGLYGLSSNEPATLYSINTSDGTATSILTLNGAASITGLSFLQGTLYGVDLYPGVINFYFFGAILTDGNLTELGNQNFSSNWWGLASDEVNGVLYSIDTENNDVLMAQFPDGSFAIIGSGTGTDGAGMAYDDLNGILYALDSDRTLYTISTTTGNSTLIGPTGLPGGSLYVGLAYDECNQILYANDGDTGELYILDATNGAATLIGSNGVGERIDGLAWKGECGPTPTPTISQIPTLSEWGMIAMAGLMGIVGFIVIRRRKVTA